MILNQNSIKQAKKGFYSHNISVTDILFSLNECSYFILVNKMELLKDSIL